jgi:hypothetical protein
MTRQAIALSAVICLLSLGVSAEESIDVYTGNGHGFWLRLLRMTHNNDATHALKITLKASGYMKKPARSPWPDDDFEIKTERALVTEDVFSKARDLASLAIRQSSDTEEQPGIMPPDQGEKAEVAAPKSRWRSTNDFLAGLRIVDTNTVHMKVWFGYEDSGQECMYAPLRGAAGEIDRLLTDAVWKDAMDDEVRAFTDSVFREQSASFSRPFYWWIRERLVMVAGAAGSDAVVPVLLDLLRHGAFEQNQGVIDRNCAYIVTALDGVTGRQLRFFPEGQQPDANRKPRPLKDVVADYLRIYGLKPAATTAVPGTAK